MEYCLECRNLSKRFGAKTALDGVNLSIAPGRVVGLLGPNGSGKTTLIKLVNGLLTPTAGEVTVCGLRPGKESKALVSYLPDRPCLPEWMSAKQLMDYYADFYEDFDRAKAADMLARLGLSQELKVGQMSKGMKEKTQLILVMSRKARLYLLDEPIGGVDPATRDFILDTIIRNYSEDASVVISTHLISDVENVLDDVIFLREGQVSLQASVDDIREQYGKSVDALFREVFRC
ncbi:MAG: ABC transporter ATP-binding protein [Oscillospiraceae bacterium]|nr:ABC transporter ATP-binding protein [Oscillospiraceae bacterium]